MSWTSAAMGATFVATGLLAALLNVALPVRRQHPRTTSLTTALRTALPVITPPARARRNREARVGPVLARHLPRAPLILLLSVAGDPPGWNVERLAATAITGAAASATLGCVLGTAATGLSGAIAGAAIGFACGAAVPFVWLRSRARQRSAHICAALPDAIDLLAVTVAAGLSFDAALARVAQSLTGPLADELRRMGKEIALGRSRSDALEQLGQRTGVSQIQSLASAIGQAESSGTPIGGILRVLADEQRTHRFLRMEERAAQLPVKLVIPLVLCILPALFVVVIGPAAITVIDGGGLP